MTAAFPEIDTLLPHREIYQLLDKVLDFHPPTIVVQAEIKSSELLSDQNQNLPAWFGIELMAQTAAAYIGLLARQQGREPPKVGYLVGTRKYEATEGVFQQGHMLKIIAEMIYRDASGLGSFSCKIMRDEEVIADAVVNVYEPPILNESKIS